MFPAGVLVLLLSISARGFVLQQQGCTVRVNGGDLPDPQPLILRGESDLPEFYYPQKNDTLTLKTGEVLRLHCLGKNTFTHKPVSDDRKQIDAACVRETDFISEGSYYELKQLKCKAPAWHVAERKGKCLNGKFTGIQIGFKISNEHFLTLLDVCFDEQNYDAVYSRFTMTRFIAGLQRKAPRPFFSAASFYPKIDVNNQFRRATQQSTLARILRSKDLAEQYIKSEGDLFLSRGHLSAKADFVYATQQRATFYYVNVAPQWQSFNGYNWMYLENSVRDFVVKKRVDMEVITGTWGIATLPDVDGKEQPLYLYADKKSGKRSIKVPKYFWKVLYRPDTKEGVAFIGMNNPYHKTVIEDIFCVDVCESFPWLKWNQKNETAGFSFCCDVNDFRKTVDTLPDDIQVQSLLK